MKKCFLLFIGFAALGLGTLGITLPILPTVPFYMLTGVCFAKSSKRLYHWFVRTSIYKNYLESYVKKEGMTIRARLSIILMVTLLMAFGFVIMLSKKLYIPCVIMLCVWLGHIWYFGLRVKAIRN